MTSSNTFIKRLLVLLLLFNFKIYTSNAQTVIVVPNSSLTAGNTNFYSGPFNFQQNTYQLIIASSQLTGLLNNQINSISFRLSPQGSLLHPTQAQSYSNYDIYIANGVAPQNRSLTFNNNIIGTKTLVRSGPLTVPINSFPIGSNPNSFGHEITFNNSYLYSGGNLVIEIRHTALPVQVGFANEAIPATGLGYGTLFTSCGTSASYTATSGVQANFSVIRLNNSNLGLIEYDNSNFSIYPNPTNDYLLIESKINIDRVEILNQLGQLVLEENIKTNKRMLDVSKLVYGVYYIKVSSSLNSKILRFIKN